jgi:hypothetical protein
LRLGDIYEIFIQEGIKADPRESKQIHRQLQVAKKAYRSLSRKQQKFFDKRNFTNPYPDTQILFGQLHEDIHTVLVGIDIDLGELLLAQHLNRVGRRIDLVLSHHPQGRGLAGLLDVMTLQTDLLEHLGIAPRIAQELMTRRIEEVSRRVHSANYMRVTDAARLLSLPFMCCHTVADNHVVSYLQKVINTEHPKTLQDIIDLLLKEPEYHDAALQQMGPRIFLGKPNDLAGKVLVDMTGGTEGSKEIFGRLSQGGISTVVGMHLSENHFEKMKQEYLKVIIAGHIASDSLGMNLLLDKLQRQGSLEILACSGFRRFSR